MDDDSSFLQQPRQPSHVFIQKRECVYIIIYCNLYIIHKLTNRIIAAAQIQYKDINFCFYLLTYPQRDTIPHNAYTRYPPQLHTIPNVDHWGKDWAKWVSPRLYSQIYSVQRQAKS